MGGLNGIVIKSHGSMDAIGTAGAIDLGYAMVRDELLAKIRDMLAQGPNEAAGTVPPASGAAFADAGTARMNEP